jgi:hypothetical protein
MTIIGTAARESVSRNGAIVSNHGCPPSSHHILHHEWSGIPNVSKRGIEGLADAAVGVYSQIPWRSNPAAALRYVALTCDVSGACSDLPSNRERTSSSIQESKTAAEFLVEFRSWTARADSTEAGTCTVPEMRAKLEL